MDTAGLDNVRLDNDNADAISVIPMDLITVTYLLTDDHATDTVSLANIVWRNKKYVPWNVYLPNVVAFHTPLSKYLTVIVMTVN